MSATEAKGKYAGVTVTHAVLDTVIEQIYTDMPSADPLNDVSTRVVGALLNNFRDVSEWNLNGHYGAAAIVTHNGALWYSTMNLPAGTQPGVDPGWRQMSIKHLVAMFDLLTNQAPAGFRTVLMNDGSGNVSWVSVTSLFTGAVVAPELLAAVQAIINPVPGQPVPAVGVAFTG